MNIIRKTKSIGLLLNEFQRENGAISAIDLIERLQNIVNKTTVYRNLEKLEAEGVLHSFTGKNGIRWYAQCSDCSKGNHIDNHPHFECTSCGKVDCISIEVSIPDLPNRIISNSQILLQGICETCLV